jgi:hypothetical protein
MQKGSDGCKGFSLVSVRGTIQDPNSLSKGRIGAQEFNKLLALPSPFRPDQFLVLLEIQPSCKAILKARGFVRNKQQHEIGLHEKLWALNEMKGVQKKITLRIFHCLVA